MKHTLHGKEALQGQTVAPHQTLKTPMNLFHSLRIPSNSSEAVIPPGQQQPSAGPSASNAPSSPEFTVQKSRLNFPVSDTPITNRLELSLQPKPRLNFGISTMPHGHGALDMPQEAHHKLQLISDTSVASHGIATQDVLLDNSKTLRLKLDLAAKPLLKPELNIATSSHLKSEDNAKSTMVLDPDTSHKPPSRQSAGIGRPLLNFNLTSRKVTDPTRKQVPELPDNLLTLPGEGNGFEDVQKAMAEVVAKTAENLPALQDVSRCLFAPEVFEKGSDLWEKVWQYPAKAKSPVVPMDWNDDPGEHCSSRQFNRPNHGF
jgi:hypothetical protein